ncbi:MAG: hypothetical protein HY541_08940 [Deltaproteobacteria bacterium]|nr:hypothetical protein [Deltaproteobacteria bacterium]
MGIEAIGIKGELQTCQITDSDFWLAEENNNKPDRTYWDYFVDPKISWYERAVAGAALPVAGLLSLAGCGKCADRDGDGYVNEACLGDGIGDCDDKNNLVNPGIDENQYNDIDDDCDGMID